VISGMMRVQLDTGVPVFSCVLTPQHFDETPERIAFFRDHLIMKGTEVGNACLNMLAALAVAKA
jgi:6,7-dimethyl-8-ribityllumazine synthase